MTISDTEKQSGAKTAQPSTDAAAGLTGLQHPKMVRRLQIVVVVLGIVLLAGLAAVAARIAYLVLEAPDQQTASTKSVNHAARLPAAQPNALPAGADLPDLTLPSGATVKHIATGPDTLAIHYQSDKGQEIVIINTATGQITRRLRIETAQQ
ncbi:MAG: hypothetical protein K0U74_12830 [Alphaproteobacteria bacterium]|nr:hypothetical protein [Alphaproteobacteria bacterium]